MAAAAATTTESKFDCHALREILAARFDFMPLAIFRGSEKIAV